MINRMPGRVLCVVSVWLLFICCTAYASLPRANDDRYFTDEDTEVSFNVLLNDFDADIGAGQAMHGLQSGEAATNHHDMMRSAHRPSLVPAGRI